MSIQILPPKTSISSEIGQALGPALAQGSQQQFQRGLTQEALGGLGNLSSNASPFELAKALISATAGIPGAERYVGQLFPLLLQQMQSKAAFPGGGGPSEGQTQQPGAGTIPEGTGGYLGNPYSQAQIKKAAEDYARQTGTGIEGYNQKFNQLLQESNLSSQRRGEIETRAREFPELQRRPELLPHFMKSVGKFKGEGDPEKLLERSYRDFQTELADLTKLDARDFNRIENFETLAPTLQDLDKKGLGTEARKTLLAKGLKPYQFSHLFSKEGEKQAAATKSFPSAKGPRDVSQLRMREFLQKTLDSDSPLPTMAFDLFNKGYDWESLAPAMREILGDRITQRQTIDIGDVETGEFRKPSMTDIFRRGLGKQIPFRTR